MYNNKLKDKAKELIDKNLPFEIQALHAAYIEYISTLEPEACLKQANMLVDDYKALKAYEKMDEISNMIDDLFNKKENGLFDKITQEIKELPKDRLIHFELDDRVKTYNRYREKVYKFMLYASLINRFELLTNNEVASIVVQKVRKDVEELRNRTDINPDLFNRISNLKNEDPDIKYIDPKLLQEISAHKADISVGGFQTLLNEKTNEYNKIMNNIVVNNKAIKKLKKQKFIIGNLAYMCLAVGIFGGIKVCKHFGWYDDDIDKKYSIKVTTESYDEQAFAVTDASTTQIVEEHSYWDTTRRYVTEFGDLTENGNVLVRIYDYTDSPITDEELKTVELDERKLVYNNYVDYSSVKNEKNSIKCLFGVCNGVAHRDISHVDFIETIKKVPKDIFAKIVISLIPSIICMFPSIVVSSILVGASGIDTADAETGKLLLDVETEKLKKLNEELKKKLEEILPELNELKQQQLASKTLESINGSDVDKQLDEMRTARK